MTSDPDVGIFGRRQDFSQRAKDPFRFAAINRCQVSKLARLDGRLDFVAQAEIDKPDNASGQHQQIAGMQIRMEKAITEHLRERGKHEPLGIEFLIKPPENGFGAARP